MRTEQVSSYMIYPTRPDVNIRKQLITILCPKGIRDQLYSVKIMRQHKAEPHQVQAA